MKPLRLLIGLFAVGLVAVGASVLPQQSRPTGATSLAAVYPNTADGLRQLLNTMLLAARNDDQEHLWSQIADMEIPDYAHWFPRTFGQDKGQKLTNEYAKSLKDDELWFEMLWTELAKQQGEISIGKWNPAARRTDAAKKDDALAGPADQFNAGWTKTDASAGPERQPIGYFYFVDGKFRLNGFPREVRIISTTKPGPVVPGKLIGKVQPVYPETAQKLRLQGTVAVNVIIHKDGTVTVQNVGAGHPLFAPSAVAAVQQWRYQPATVGGEPVEVQTKVYVTFALSKPPDKTN